MSNASLPLEMIKSANLMEQLMSYLGTEEGKRMLTGAGIGGGLGALTGGMTGGWRGGLVGLLTGGALGGAAGHNWDRLMGTGTPAPRQNARNLTGRPVLPLRPVDWRAGDRNANMTSRPVSPLRPADWRVGDRNANMPYGTMWGN